ncbi:hypothetical protein BDN72DRAFT_383656 [Pluteus cervinus]|uniref:Uncharacterized protein n=1 Tax=Pluteus cervinus TaxID=181527 RepID=A0ACD3AB24_9AGAR|nr:hypothetical protein BDN72DRAFT_383656 [Pluteus cervinus]
MGTYSAIYTRLAFQQLLLLTHFLMRDSDGPTANAVLFKQYCTVASSTLYLYDLLLTLDLEVNLLWPSKWTLFKVVYLLQRYLPLVDTMILVMMWEFGHFNSETCESLYRASGWPFVVGMILSEAILIRRTLAVWGDNRKLQIAIYLAFLCWMISIYWMLGIYDNTLTYHSSTSSMPGIHCFTTGKAHFNSLCWVLFTVFDIGLLILISIPAYRAYRSRDDSAVLGSMLAQVVYRDGILYYLCLVALSASNIILTLKLPRDYADMLYSLEMIMYPILTSHVVLHIREQAYQSQVISLNLPNSVSINAEAEFQRSGI